MLLVGTPLVLAQWWLLNGFGQDLDVQAGVFPSTHVKPLVVWGTVAEKKGAPGLAWTLHVEPELGVWEQLPGLTCSDAAAQSSEESPEFYVSSLPFRSLENRACFI